MSALYQEIFAQSVLAILNALSVIALVLSYLAIFIKQTFFRSFANRNGTVKNNKKLAITLGLTSLICILAWLPQGVLLIYSMISPDFFKLSLAYLVIAADAVCFSNSFLNLVVYTFRMGQVRRELKKLFCKTCFAMNSVGVANIDQRPGQRSNVIPLARQTDQKTYPRQLRPRDMEKQVLNTFSSMKEKVQQKPAVVSVRRSMSFPQILIVHDEHKAVNQRSCSL